jgi:dihydrofolate reductase
MPLLAELTPTGNAVAWDLIHIWRVADGAIVEHWACRDDVGLLAQVGGWPRSRWSRTCVRLSTPVGALRRLLRAIEVPEERSGLRSVLATVDDDFGGPRVWTAVRPDTQRSDPVRTREPPRRHGGSTTMSCRRGPGLHPHRTTALEEDEMTATYTFDVFSSLDGYGAASANWTGYWGKQGPELLDHRLDLYSEEQRMVFGATTYRAFVRMLASSTEESEVRDPWVTRMTSMPATVVSTTLEEPLDWPDATLVSGDAVDVVARLKEESEVPLRSHGSLSMNRALMAAGLVDRVQVTIFPVITGQTGLDPIFRGAADFDLELVESRTLDGRTQELVYRPTLH